MLEHYYNVTKGTMLDPSEASRRILTVDGKPEHVRSTIMTSMALNNGRLSGSGMS